MVADLPPEGDLAVRVYRNFRKARSLGEFGNKSNSIPARTHLHGSGTLTVPVLLVGLLAELIKIPDPAG